MLVLVLQYTPRRLLNRGLHELGLLRLHADLEVPLDLIADLQIVALHVDSALVRLLQKDAIQESHLSCLSF